jgi:hypothetical protein
VERHADQGLISKRHLRAASIARGRRDLLITQSPPAASQNNGSTLVSFGTRQACSGLMAPGMRPRPHSSRNHCGETSSWAAAWANVI